MSSWETAALRLQSNVTADSTPNPSHKSLSTLPRKRTKARTVTGVKEVSGEEESIKNKGWKPLSLSTPILSAVVALTVLLAVAIETLAQRSAAQGGLALSPSLDDIPSYAKFSYLYVPTIIAVLYSLIWSWIDLDVKRMQPWFELSKSSGATGKNSLFLDYQYDFVGFVPFRAAKSKHWPSFYAGTAMVIVFWALTPLQSTLLGTDVVTQTNAASISVRSRLIPMAEQKPFFNPQILNTAYAIGWLNQSLPRFTTRKYALLPYYINDTTAPPNVESNWTAVTTKLSTELECWPAEIGRDDDAPTSTYYFLNGQGCKAEVSFQSKVSMRYIGFWGSPYSDFALNSPKCPPTENSTHQFLALWTSSPPFKPGREPTYNMTGFFCQPQYYKQRVLATVRSTTYEPEFEAIGPREILSTSEFNTSAFEFLLANGVEQDLWIRDFPFNRVVEQTPRLNITNFSRPTDNMIGFSMAGRSISLYDFYSHDVFKGALEDAHQYVFSAAVSSLLTNETDGFNRTASVDFYMTGIVVSRTFAIAVESTLLLVATLTALTLWYCRKIPSNLPTNPSSINRHIDIFRNSPHLLKMFQNMDSIDDKNLTEEFKHDQFRLLHDYETKSTELVVEDRMFIPDDANKENTASKGYYEPVKPLVLRRWVGLLFIAVLIGAMVVLSYFKEQEKRLNGLHRPSENFEVLQLLENYIPTVFATLIEPLWVLLTRLLCVLQPFRDLWAGKAEASRSIDATYTSIPPQLVFWRAIKAKHFILALLCTMAFLGNLLAVGLGSLFNEAPATALYPEIMRPSYAARFDNSSVFGLGLFFDQNLMGTTQYQDHLYIASANLSSGTALPPWVTNEYYFQRHNFTNSNKGNSDDTFSLEARGFGVNSNCTAIPTFKIPVFKTPSKVYYPDEMPDESFCPQRLFINVAAQDIRENMSNRTRGPSSAQYCRTLTTSSGDEPCDKTLTLGWARTDNAENINGTMHASMILCYPVFETAMFNITVDRVGNVLSYNRTTELQGKLDYDESSLHTDMISESYNRQWNTVNTLWQNDTVARDWFNYLIVVVNGSRSAVDPAEPVPDSKTLLPVVGDIYRRLFPIFLSLNDHLFQHADDEPSITAIRSTKETRIFMEDASFIITMTILGLNTLVAIVFYSRSVEFVLPRMPTTLGSILAYVAPSRLAGPAYKSIPGQAGRTLSFGRYIGPDGDVHLGIESDPHVVHIDPSSLESNKGLFDRMKKKVMRSKRVSRSSGTWI